jgi:tetratricopeptide (TPR) repeat protein
MSLSKKDRKYILKNYPSMSVRELAKALGSSAREVKDVLESAGREVHDVVPGEPGPVLGHTPARFLGVMVIVAVISVIYLNSMRNGFHYDDIHSLLQNYAVQVEPIKNPQSLKLFWRYFREPELFSSRPNVGMPRPILLSTFGFNYMMGTIMCDKFGFWCGERGYDPRGWILFNVLLHTANAIIIYIIICHFTGRGRVALLVALLFAAHPINTETVNYINCRSESLVSLFMLLTFYFFGRSLRDDRIKWFVLSMAFFALGLLSKELAIVMPAILLWFDFVFICPSERDDSGFFDRLIYCVRRRWAWYLCIILLPVLYLYYRDLVQGHLVKPSNSPVKDYFITELRIMITYIRLLFLPFYQNISYENNLIRFASFVRQWRDTLTVLGSVLTLGLFAGLGLAWYRSRPVISLAIANFFIILSVTSSFIPLNAFMNEHRLYLPSLSACILIAGLLDRTASHLNHRGGADGKVWPVTIQGMACLIVVIFASLSVARNFTWHTDLTVWLDSVRNSPTKAQVVSDLGNAYYRGGRSLTTRGDIGKDGSISKKDQMVIQQIFNEQVPEGSISPQVRKKLDELYEKGLNRAELLYLWAIRVEISYYKAWHNLGTINYTYSDIDKKKRDPESAKMHLKRAVWYFERAAKIYPNGESFNDCASAIMALKNLETDPEKKRELLKRAEVLYLKGIKYNPELQKGYLNISNVMREQGRYEEALPYVEMAIEVNPLHTAPYLMKYRLLMELKRFKEAIEALDRCLYVDPGNMRCMEEKSKLEKGMKQPAPTAPPSPAPAPPTP